MKSHSNLYPQITDFENLWHAAKKAQRGKRFRPDVATFNLDREGNLLALQRELEAKTYRPGAYHTFMVRDPKRRWISKAPYRDRVVHHALCNVIEPLFDRTFIDDSYACRVGKGTHAALRRVKQYVRRYRYVFQGDVAKYFPSIDHGLLKGALRRKIRCRDTLWLAGQIIDASYDAGPVYVHREGESLLDPLERPRGLPLGNQTSQFFANVYLNPFDHFVKEVLRVPGYLRYVDDFLLFANDKRWLREAGEQSSQYLGDLCLTLHPKKSALYPVKHGVSFVGFRVFPDRVRVQRESARRYGRRLKLLRQKYAKGEVGPDEVRSSLAAWLGHVRHADSVELRKHVFAGLTFRRGGEL